MKFQKILPIALAAGLALTGLAAPLPQAAAADAYDGSASQYVGKHDIPDSPYYMHPDVYHMTSNEHLLVLSHFATTQQITGYTCGPSAANMVVAYFKGAPIDDEMAVAGIMSTDTKTGTETWGMVRYFEKLGWEVHSALSDETPADYAAFLSFVSENLAAGTPIIVENVDWGGHWRVIIGYDTMGTAHTGDDVLLMADPFDTTDHLQDGYTIVAAERFFEMWFDHHLFPVNLRERQWLTARPSETL